jgi:signal transduction histidine kinase
MVLSLIKEDGEGLLMPESMVGIQQAENSVGRLIALVNNLLDLDRMEAGRMTVAPRDVNVRQVVNDAVSAISGMAMQKNINFQCQMDDNLAAFFDYDRVAQVIVNLLANAIKFSPAQATITIAANRKKDFVAIRVIDQGRGVPAEMREAIFDRFKQVKASDATVEKGSGLGLAICKAIVERHHGRIGVEPNPGNGSIFWFTMPSSRVVFETRESENDG